MAAAYALPENFPFRDLILLCAFCVVVGTLILQGLTLKPLIGALGLSEESEVDQEVRSTNERLVKLALELLDGDTSDAAQLLRQELSFAGDETQPDRPAHEHLRSRVIVEQRKLLVQLRAQGDIGDDAFHEVEARLDIAELSVGVR
jgi:monovalent cation/hydrogen antiporter